MKAVISRKELLEVMTLVLPGIETGMTILEGADTFVFEEENVHTFNNKVSVTAPYKLLKGSLKGTVKAKEFYDLINRFTENEITVSVREKEWQLVCGRANVKLVLFEGDWLKRVFKVVPEDGDWKPLPNDFMEGLKICLFGKNGSQLAGVFVDGQVMLSTDERRINWYLMDDPMDTFWIADDAVKDIMKMGGVKEYMLAGSWIHFRTEKGITYSASKLDSGHYMQDSLRAIIKSHAKEADDIGNELPGALMNVINRASSFSIEVENRDTVDVTFSNDGIQVHSQRTAGEYDESVDWEKPFKKEFEPVRVRVEFDVIETCMRTSKKFYIKRIMGKKNRMVTRLVFEVPKGMIVISTYSVK